MSGRVARQIPRLRSGRDAEVAKQLGRAVRDAQDATRRIAICGFLIEAIASELPHGQLGPWIDAHEAIIGAKRSSIFAWRQFTTNLLEAIGVQKSNALDFSVPLHEALTLPIAKLPREIQSVRQKIDDLIEGRSYRQLSFQFQSEAGPGSGSYDRSERGKGKTGITAQPFDAQADALAVEFWKFLRHWEQRALDAPAQTSTHSD